MRGIASIMAMGTGSVVSAASYLLDENCEGTGTPAGWTNTFGSPNWDYTTVALEGSQSLFLTTSGAAAQTRAPDWTNVTEIFGYFRFRTPAGTAPGSLQAIATIQPNGGGTSLQISLATTMRIQISGGSPANALSFDTTYHVWFHYLQGSGANASRNIGFSTDGTRPTAGGNFTENNAASETLLAGRFLLGNSGTGHNSNLIFDKIRIATTQIGNNGDI